MVPFDRIGRVDQFAYLCRVLKIAAQVFEYSDEKIGIPEWRKVVSRVFRKNSEAFVPTSDLGYISLLSDIFLLPFQLVFLFQLVEMLHVQVPLGAPFL